MGAKDQVVRFAMASAVYTLAAWAALTLSRASGGIASIWFANAMLLGYALRRPPRVLPPLLAAAVLGAGLASMALVRPFGLGLLGGVANAVEIGLVYSMLRLLRLQPGTSPPDRDVALFLFAAILLAPAAGAALGATVALAMSDEPWLVLWRDWWRSDFFGMFLGLPLVWTFHRTTARELLIGRLSPAFWLLAALVAGTVCLALTRLGHPFVVIALPLLLVAIRTGVFGTAVCNVLMVVTVFLVVHAQQRGALPLPEGAREVLPIGNVWLQACISAVGPLLVAFIGEQRARERERAGRAGDRLQVIADNLPAFIAEIGPDFRYRYANAKYREAFGVTPDELIGKRPADVLGPEAEAQLRPHMERALQGIPARFEFELPNGIHLEASYQPLPHGAGFVVLSHDVTWRHEADRRFRNLLESAPDAMVVLERASRRIVLVNAQAERMFGYTREELLGQPIGRFIDDPDGVATGVARRYLESAREGEPGDVILFVGRRRDGSRFPVEAVLSRLHGSEQTQIVAAIRDVTARVRTEQALRDERERAHVTLNAIGDAVITCDTALAITSMNPIAEDITGWSRHDAVGRSVHEVVRLREADGSTAIALSLAVETGEAAGVQLPSAMLCRADGRCVHVDVSDATLRDDAGAMIGGVIVLRDISQAHAMAQRMAYLAQHDHLTGLPNRVLLNDRLDEVLARFADGAGNGDCGALLFLDLDLFKRINDSLGHHTGDRVLQRIAQRLADGVRPGDTVSRQGGDEFVVLLPDLPEKTYADRLADALIRAIEAPVLVDGRALHVSASIGITLFPDNGVDPKTLTKQADTALYHAKQAGRGRWSHFTSSMSERADLRLRLETELRAAVAGGQLYLVYQPKVELPSGTVCGVEALVRWRHPDGHTVSPVEFIPIAEETGLITAIDEWVLREACRQVRAWIDAGLTPLPVAVNVSLARLDPERLLDNLRRALDDSALPPALLEVEFTESQMLGQYARARQLVEAIRALGIRLAVDDFGTGYASLSYLTDYRFDTIKIDRSFVQGLPGEREQRAVVQAILGIAQSLECRVVAEGVETAEQEAALFGLGCTLMQGYRFGRPVEPAELEARLGVAISAGG